MTLDPQIELCLFENGDGVEAVDCILFDGATAVIKRQITHNYQRDG